jgi:uncharacterized protein involved in outer membrane biogenesis
MGRGLRWTLGSAVIVLAAAIAVPFLVPVSHFIPELERIASEKLNQPVTIDDLRLHLVPTPRVVANGIVIGKRAEIAVGELEIVPDVLSFVSGPRSVPLIRAERLQVQEAALAIGKGMPKGEAGEPIHLRRILLKEVTLHHSKVQLPPFDADVELAEGLSLTQARLESRDGSVRLRLQAGGGLELTARNWTLPAGAPLTFESLVAKGTLKAEQLDLSQVEGLIYGGKIEGSARASWGKQWTVSGKANLAGVDLVPVQQALGKPARLSGKLKADAVFSQRSSGLTLDGPFEVVGGAYQGVDLSKAGDITGSAAVDDATPFEELTGKLQVRGKQVKLSELCVRSPKVVAGGNVEIGADQQLSGKLDVSVAKTGGFVGVPVSLGGTTSDPSVTPTKGYVIGAVIGTVLLPGIGTSLGASAGSRLEGVSTGCK